MKKKEEVDDDIHLQLTNANCVPSYHQHHSICKWIYRRLRRFILLQSWSNFILFSLLIILVFFILFSHFYVLIQSSSWSPSSSESPRSLSSLEILAKNEYYQYNDKLSSIDAHPSYRLRAAQINEQLRQIELSLKENRQILQSIRNSINLVKMNFTAQINNRDPYTKDSSNPDSRIWVEDVFREKAEQDQICQNMLYFSSFSGDINMEKVYDRLSFDNLDGGVWKQGWPLEIQEEDFLKPKPKLKVFIVPHSHNDPGWIKTFDVYFSKQTQHILTNAVEFLTQHPDMRFIWAESSYLSAWWETSDQAHREMLKKLVLESRLEIVTGGWVMNDEANTHYWSMLTQMIEGHEWLQEALGIDRPKHGWAIDPFGLSPTMAYLLKSMGFRAMVIQRVHYSIKKHLAQNYDLEFRWRQHWEHDHFANTGNNGQQKDILCHIEPFYSYDIPHTCGPDPKICCQFDFKRLPPSKSKCPWRINPQVINEDNIEERFVVINDVHNYEFRQIIRAKTLLDQYRKKSLLYRTNSLLVPLGDDFRYDDMKEWKNQYNNYRRLMDYLNLRPQFNVEIKFSTLNDYFDSLLKSSNENGIIFKAADNFSTLVGDFFTYADRDDHYWSGYYTSKPFYKRFERVLASHLRATEIIFSMANILTNNFTTSSIMIDKDPFEYLTYEFMFARQNLALFQHHDGITGTAKDSVVVDYANRMLRSFQILQQVATVSFAAISNRSIPELEFMHNFPNIYTPLKKHLFRLNSNSKKFFILYNSLGWALDAQVFCFDIFWSSKNDTMPDWCLTLTNQSDNNNSIKMIQMNHLWPQTSFSTEPIEKHREVCFQPKLPALSFTQYCLGQCRCSPSDSRGYRHHEKHESFVTLYNSHRDAMVATKPFDYHILSLVSDALNTTIENEMIRLTFHSTTMNGLLKSWSYYDLERKQWITMDVCLKIMTYGTRSGGKTVQKSGAYIFLPDQVEPVNLEWLGKPKIRLLIGNLESRYEWMVDEPYPVHIRFSLYRGRPTVEVQAQFHLHGQYGANRELLIRFEVPDIHNGDRFYTDLNGFQIISRKRYQKIPLQGNVYPLNTMAWIEDSKHRFSVISGQPLGVTSLRSGTMEVFMDRRLLQDDFRGLNQGVLDNRYTQELFRLMLEPLNNTSRTNKASLFPSSMMMFESQTLLNPIIGLTSKQMEDDSAILSIHNSSSSLSNTLKLLRYSLPCDLHLLNFRRSISKYREFGLWLHRTALNCDSKCLQQSSSNQINLGEYFSEEIVSRLEPKMYPTGISWLDDSSKRINSNFKLLNETLEILPMQIRTYKLFRTKKLQKSSNFNFSS